jgi:hypothetical protein
MNSIELPVSELKTVLPGLKHLIVRKPLRPILGCVHLSCPNPGQVRLQVTDIGATATCTLEGTADPGVSLFVPYEELVRATKGAGKDDVLRLRSDSGRVLLSHNVAGSWLDRPLPVFDADEWPAMAELDCPVELPLELPRVLAESLDFCAEPNRESLNGSWLDVTDPKSHYVMASDGRRLFSANSFTFDLQESVLVPCHRFLKWEGFVTDGPWRCGLKPATADCVRTLTLTSNRWSFTSRLNETVQPNWRQVIPSNITTQVRFSDSAVATLLELLPKLPGYDLRNQDVQFRFSSTKSTVTGKTDEHRSIVELSGVDVQGSALDVCVNRTSVIEALQLGLTELDLADALSPMVFRKAGRRLVVVPLRPPEETPVQPSLKPQSAPEPVPETPMNTQPAEPTNAIRQAIQKVESLKDNLKTMLTDMNEVLKTLHLALKEKRASEKEVEEIRAALQSLQKIRI